MAMLTNTKFVERPYHFRWKTMKDKDAAAFSSGIPRYQVNVCDWYHMPLEPCPTCGYALSTVDHHCRHCATASRPIPSLPMKHLQQMIVMAVVGLSVLVYLIFLR
jgi:hypothetical protein